MLSILLPIAALFALNVLTPGASFVLTVRNTLAHGGRAGCGIALGLVTADTTLAALALAGLAAVLKTYDSATLALGFIGGIWIADSGLNMLLHPRQGNIDVDSGTDSSNQMGFSSCYRVGGSVGFSNPQAIIFFASVFASGLASDLNALQSVCTVLTIFAASLCIRCGIVWMVTFPAIKSGYLARRREVETVSGAALLFFGAKLAIKALVPWMVNLAAIYFPLQSMAN